MNFFMDGAPKYLRCYEKKKNLPIDGFAEYLVDEGLMEPEDGDEEDEEDEDIDWDA
jgi:hypothetical protein